MPESTTELIKQKLDVADFLRGYLNLQPAGRNFKALCPFHKEKTPSFMISPERQSWHCFGCNIGGDVFSFLMRYENLEFGEALRVLAERAGVELKRLNPAEHKFAGLLYEINSAAKEFFKKSLGVFAGARKYLDERGLKQETIEEFELGWAPAASEALGLHLLKSGYVPDDIIRAGLCLKSDRGMMFDRFRGRVMFPIHNHMGKVIGFTGRILPQFDAEGIGKYINSPESPIFVKSKVLYGFHKTKNFIKEANSAFLVEGQMDFLMSWQAGVKNVIACSGTALTADHLRLLRRVGEEMVLSFDSDEAGSTAAERAIDLAEQNDFSVKVAVLVDAKDPAEAVQKNPAMLHEAIKGAVPAPQFYVNKYLPGKGVLDYSRREELSALRVVLGKFKDIASPVARNFWLKELSDRTGVAERILTEEMDRIESSRDLRRESAEQSAPEIQARRPSRRELIGERLLGVAIARNAFSLLDDVEAHLAELHLRALGMLKSGIRKSDDAHLDGMLNLIILGSKDLSDDEAGELKQELAKECVKEKRNALTGMIRQAEKAGDEAQIKSALEELHQLSAQTTQ